MIRFFDNGGTIFIMTIRSLRGRKNKKGKGKVLSRYFTKQKVVYCFCKKNRAYVSKRARASECVSITEKGKKPGSNKSTLFYKSPCVLKIYRMKWSQGGMAVAPPMPCHHIAIVIIIMIPIASMSSSSSSTLPVKKYRQRRKIVGL